MIDAKRSCTSARIGTTSTSDEGGLTVTELVVDDACDVFIRSHNSDDAWAERRGVTGEGGKCSSLAVSGCP